MDKRRLGKSDVKITPILMGTWQAGKRMWGARYPEQAKDNAQAATVQLSDAELQEIDAIGRIVTDYLDDGSVMWDW